MNDRHLSPLLRSVLVACMCCGLAGISLPPSDAHAAGRVSQADLDLLNNRLAEALKRRRFEAVPPIIAEIKASGRKYSPTLFYFEGFALLKLERLTEAERAFRAYLKAAGRSGAYTPDSRQRIVEIEALIKPAMARYKALLAKKRTRRVAGELARLESSLGDRVSGPRAEHERAVAARGREAEAERARAATEKADLAKRAKAPWEKVLKTESRGAYRLFGLTLPGDGTIAAVGDALVPACKKSQKWLVRLNAAGDIVREYNHCERRVAENDQGFHSRFNDISLSSDGHLIAVGVGQRGLGQVGIINKMQTEKNFFDWRAFGFSGPDWNRLKLRGALTSIFEGSRSTRSGKVLGAGYLRVGDNSHGAIVKYDTLGQRLWMGYSELERVEFHDVTELADGRVLAVGSGKESVRFGGWDKKGYFEAFTAKGERAGGGRLYDGKVVLRGVAATADGGAIIVGEVETGDRGRQTHLVRLDRGLKVVWKRSFGGPGRNQARRIAVTDGGYVAVGQYTKPGGSSEGWIFKIDDNGKMLWSETHGGPLSDNLTDLAILPGNAGIVAVGYKGQSGWVLKLNARGQFK